MGVSEKVVQGVNTKKERKFVGVRKCVYVTPKSSGGLVLRAGVPGAT